MVLPTVRVVDANVDFLRGGDKRYIQQLCAWGDLLLLQEAKTFDLADLLPEGWESLQDTTDEATRGSCIAYRTSVLEHRWDRLVLGAAPFIDGRRVGMLPRSIQLAGFRHIESGRGFVAASAHEPPARFRPLQPLYTRRLAVIARRYPRIVVGADANMPLTRFASQLGMRAHGEGIVGLATNLGVWGKRVVRPWGMKRGLTDHPAITARIMLPKEN